MGAGCRAESITMPAGQRETGRWWWSSRAGLVAASGSQNLPPMAPVAPCSPSLPPTTADPQQPPINLLLPGQTIKWSSTYHRNTPHIPPNIAIGIGKMCTTIKHQGIQALRLMIRLFSNLPSACLFLQTGAQGVLFRNNMSIGGEERARAGITVSKLFAELFSSTNAFFFES